MRPMNAASPETTMRTSMQSRKCSQWDGWQFDTSFGSVFLGFFQ